MNMREHTRRFIPFLHRLGLLFPILILALLFNPSIAWTVPAWDCPAPFSEQTEEVSFASTPLVQYSLDPGGSLWDMQGVQIAQERERMRGRYEQWQNLPPEEKETLRRRMNQWNQMSPQEQERYQHRYDQYQQLSPDERGQMHNKLDRWQNLSPDEKEGVRRRFRQ
jgi:hypothetical protein